MDEYDKFEAIAHQPHSVYTLALMQAAMQVIEMRFPEYPRIPLTSDPMRFPSRQEATRCIVAEPRDTRMPPVDAPWVEYADKVSQSSTFDGDRVTQSLRDLVCGVPVDPSIVEGYLNLLKNMDSPTKITSIRSLQQDNDMNIGYEGIEQPAIIPFFDSQGWAFAVAYCDCIHWYDARLGGRTPRLSASGGRRVMEGWRGPQPSEPEDSAIFMLMGISRIMQRKPHVSQEAADEHKIMFRIRMLIELLAGKLEPTLEYLGEKGVIKGKRTGGASIFVSQTASLSPSLSQEDSAFNDAINMSMWEARAEDARFASLAPPMPNPVDQIFHASAEHEANPYRRIEPRGPLPTRMLTVPSPYVAPRRSASRTRLMLEQDIKSLVSRKAILENLSSSLQFVRSAAASGFSSERMLWHLGRKDRTKAKLQQRYERVLFNEKVKERMDKNIQITGLPDSQWVGMKSDFSRWKIWKDLWDMGRKYDDLGEFVTLCAFPGSMNSINIPKRQQERLLTAFKEEIDNRSSPVRQWLRDARHLCEMILTKSQPEHLLQLDYYDEESEGEVTDAVWDVYMSMDTSEELGDEDITPYQEFRWQAEGP